MHACAASPRLQSAILERRNSEFVDNYCEQANALIEPRGTMPITSEKGVYEDSTHLVACQKQIGLYYGRPSFTTCAVSSLLRQVSVGEGVPLPRPRIQVVHGTVPQKCARNALP